MGRHASGAFGGGVRGLAPLVCLLLVCCGPSVASAKSAANIETGYAPTGTLTISWVGDQGLGCAARGLCGYSGSLVIRPSGNFFGGGPGRQPIVVEDNTTVARSVARSPTGATISACSAPEAAALNLVVTRRSGRLVAVESRSPLFFSGGGGFPSAGVCAGPLASDLLPIAMPARRAGAHDYHLIGSDSFGAGPFEVTVTAHIDTHYGTMSARGRGAAEALATRRPKPKSVLHEQAMVIYRIASTVGSVGASFAGFPSPGCEPFGSCGSTGSVQLTLSPRESTLSIVGTRIVKRAVGRTAALRDLAAGRLRTFDLANGPPLNAQLRATLTVPTGGTCSDSVDEYGPGLIGQEKHGQNRLQLDPVLHGFLAGGETLRSHCPGPDTFDIVGVNGQLASATIPFADLGAHRMSLTLKASGGDGGNGYQCRRTGAIVVTLVRTSERAGTVGAPDQM